MTHLGTFGSHGAIAGERMRHRLPAKQAIKQDLPEGAPAKKMEQGKTKPSLGIVPVLF